MVSNVHSGGGAADGGERNGKARALDAHKLLMLQRPDHIFGGLSVRWCL